MTIEAALAGCKEKEIGDLADVLAALPAAVYATDAEGAIVYFNPAAERLAGRTPRLFQDKWCVSWRLYRPDGSPLPLEECPMAQMLRTGKPVRDVAVIAERPDGVRVALMPFPTPIFDANGALIGGVNLLIETEALKGAEAAAVQRSDEQTALYRFTDRLFRAQTAEEAQDAALDALLAALRCNRASLLLFDADNVMQFAAWRGLSEDYRRAVAGHTPWRPGEPQPEPIAIDDVARADLDAELKAVILREGIGALAFVPLVANGGVVGKFMIYFNEPHAFTAAEMDLALTIARQMGFSIERARAEASLRASEERYRAVVDAQAEMVCRFRPDGTILFVNAAYARARNTTPEALQNANFWDFVAPEDRAAVREMLDRLSPESPEIQIENRFAAADGERWTLWTNRATAFDAQGRCIEAQSTGIDISDRKRAEEARERLSAIVESSDDAIISKDLNGVIVSWNKGAERIFGYTPDEIVGKPVTTLMPLEYQSEEPGILARLRRGERIEHYETVRVRKDGRRIHISLTVSPVRDGQGRIIGASKIARDITERKRAEEQRALLVNELNHRVKNTLATVQSLAMQTLRNTERSAEARALFDARLAALSRAHDLLTSQNWEGASLREVVGRALAPFACEEGRIEIEGPEQRMTPKQALALSIALHELATNAAKYGALSNDSGRVRVSWLLAPRAGGQELVLTWAESGGPRVKPPVRLGFGSRLIERSLANELGGLARIEYRPEGVVSTISAPIEPRGTQPW